MIAIIQKRVISQESVSALTILSGLMLIGNALNLVLLLMIVRQTMTVAIMGIVPYFQIRAFVRQTKNAPTRWSVM